MAVNASVYDPPFPSNLPLFPNCRKSTRITTIFQNSHSHILQFILHRIQITFRNNLFLIFFFVHAPKAYKNAKISGKRNHDQPLRHLLFFFLPFGTNRTSNHKRKEAKKIPVVKILRCDDAAHGSENVSYEKTFVLTVFFHPSSARKCLVYFSLFRIMDFASWLYPRV